ncbi:MAG: NDP-hexose 4-ketoreductase, partial [Anaerolineae bacterium]|nr:NDP-hexose 4-ketoreductase [Anaerolineae bacterium]
MSQKMERFTPAARRVLSLSQEEAERLHHSEINIGHLLLGLLREHESIAAQVLGDVGTSLDAAEKVVRDAYLKEPASTQAHPIELADDIKKLLELTVDEARRQGHQIIAPEHMLLGLVRYQSTWPDLFEALDLDSEIVRQETTSLMTLYDYSHIPVE